MNKFFEVWNVRFTSPAPASKRQTWFMWTHTWTFSYCEIFEFLWTRFIMRVLKHVNCSTFCNTNEFFHTSPDSNSSSISTLLLLQFQWSPFSLICLLSQIPVRIWIYFWISTIFTQISANSNPSEVEVKTFVCGWDPCQISCTISKSPFFLLSVPLTSFPLSTRLSRSRAPVFSFRGRPAGK